MKVKIFWVSLIVLLSGLGVSGCQPTESNDLKQMTFMAGFKPQANLPFVGAYVAQEKGYFADEGLAVTIQHSAGGGEHLQLLAAGEIQVTTQDAAVLLQRRAEPGLPLVSLALVGQRGQQAFVALDNSGIETPSDWIGRTVGYKGTPPPDLFAILDSAGISQSDVNLVNVGFDPRVLTEGQVDVYPVFKSNEPNLIRSWGYELNMWDAADYGVPTLGLTYVTSEAMLAEDSDVLQGFIDATMKGMAYASNNRDEAVEIVMKYAGEEADPAHMRFMLDTEFVDYESAVTAEFTPGWQTANQWQALHDMLLEYDALPHAIDVEEAFTTQFLLP
jgi:ABC-type nitrate/sulfonate/bicarbonate transport system substrate-binding protein